VDVDVTRTLATWSIIAVVVVLVVVVIRRTIRR
jgi:Ni,Fe-hydrogenase I cytochrome b subunit